MTGSLTYQAQPPAQAPEEARRSIIQVIRDLFEKNPLANGLFIIAIVVGFFHGWLKIHYRGALTTFAFDIPIMAAMAVTFLTRGRDPVFPRTPMSDALKLLVGATSVYFLLSFVVWDVPILAAMAAFRGWCLIPLIFLLGYHLATSIRQVEFYIWAMILLGFVTGLYGILQSEDEVKRLMESDPEMMFRFQNQFYHTGTGAQFRRFSTYVSSASFASQMAFSIMFCFSRLSFKSCRWVERIILAALAAVMCYALMLTGSRSSLLQLVLALVFTAWYRRGGILFVFIPVIGFAAWKLGVKATEGDAANRYATLLDGQTIWWRLWIVFKPSWDEFVASPMGTGLGSSSHGVPMFLMRKMAGSLRPIDGDFGHLVVDMGLVGLLVFGNMLFQGCRESWRWMGRLRDTPLTVVSLPAGIFFLQSAAAFPYGSPFLGIPFGPMMWFFFGALSRLCLDYDKMVAAGATETTAFKEKFASFISTKKTRLLFGAKAGAGEEPQERTVLTNVRVAPRFVSTGYSEPPRRSTAPKKRFLYHRPKAED